MIDKRSFCMSGIYCDLNFNRLKEEKKQNVVYNKKGVFIETPFSLIPNILVMDLKCQNQ